jgi:hypothetical protein
MLSRTLRILLLTFLRNWLLTFRERNLRTKSRTELNDWVYLRLA